MGSISLPRPNMALVERVISAQGMISVFHSPGGYGKSVLLAEIRSALSAGGLATSDNITAASTMPSFPWLLLDDPDSASLAAAASDIALDRSSRSGKGIVIATRHIKALPIARLRAEGRVLRLGPQQIGIAPEESVEWLRTAVDKRTAERLAALADGWTVAVKLLLDYAHEPGACFDDDGEFVMASGLASYIDQEILADISPDWLAALRFASIVDSCSSAMLDHVRPGNDLGRHLSSLREHLPGLVDHRDGETWLNPLLRIHLSRAFGKMPQNERAEALERASEHCARTGRVAEAARLVTQVGSPDSVVEFVRRSEGLRLWVTAGYEVIREIVKLAGTRGVQDEPRLKLLKCVVLMKTGEIDEAERLLAEVVPQLGKDRQTQTDVAIVRMTLLFYGCRAISDADVTALRQSLPRGGDLPDWHIMLLQMQALLEIQRGNLDQADGVIIEGMRLVRDAGYAEIFLNIHGTNLSLARGELQLARGTLSRARKVWRETFPGDSGIELMLDVLTASLEFEAGRMSSARAHIRRSLHRMPHVEAWLDIYVAAYETIARLLVGDVGLASALTSLKAQQDALMVSGLPRVARLVQALEFCLLGEGALRGEAISEPIAAIEIAEPHSSQSWQERELFALVAGYAALQARRPEAGAIAMQELLQFAEPRGLRRSVLRAKLLLVATFEMQGETLHADREFSAALSLGAGMGMSRAFVEIGGSAVQRRCSEQIAMLDDGKITEPGMVRLLRAVGRWQNARSSERVARFTPREMDVLKAMTKGGPDKMIGRRLGITDHGVRYHLKNIYRKLGVSDRVAAVVQAKDVGILG